MKTKCRKPRLWGKTKPKLPKPISAKRDNGFSLRMINEADSRFAVVKEMRRRVEKLKSDAGADSCQKEWLCGRAVFLLARLESMELDVVEGKAIDWKQYLMTVRGLSDVLGKLGLDKEVRASQRLSDYVAEGKNGK